eukprot:1148078-Pleurochrysis_carterae.AAC.1
MSSGAITKRSFKSVGNGVGVPAFFRRLLMENRFSKRTSSMRCVRKWYARQHPTHQQLKELSAVT